MTRRLAYVTRTLVVLLLAGAAVALAGQVYALPQSVPTSQPSDSPLVTLDEENLLVLEVRLDRRGSGHGLIAYQSGDRVLLPLGELCSILELAIMVDPDNGTAEGWIIDESRSFELNLAAGTVTLNGSLSPLPPTSVGDDGADLYIDSQLLAQWLPADLTVNLQRMNMEVTPRETLPFQSRLKRDEQRSLWLASQNRSTLKYPMKLAPYRMWSWPLIDATASLYTGRVESRRLALESYADLAGMSTNLFLSHVGNSENSQTVSRLKAGRWDPDGELLGPLSATKYEFGDLFISRVPLISTSKQGLGFSISNRSLNRSREFNTTEIQGDAPPGWEAELYINGSLYDFQTIGESGKYDFTDVPLIVGNNVFRTVLYGPRGEVREIVKNENISPEMSDIGELKYRATVLHEGQGVLTTPSAQSGLLFKAWNQQIELSYALNHLHALVANFSRLTVEGRQEFFSSLTSHNSFGPLYTETILAESARGGAAISLGARTKLYGQNLFAQFMTNDNYRAEALYGTSYLNREAILRSSGNILKLGNRPLYYNLSASSRRYADSSLQRENELKAHLSTSLGQFLLSHSLSYRLRDYADETQESTLGTQLVRTQFGALSLRGDLNYELSPSRLLSAGASVNWYRTDKVQVSTRASHFLKPEYGNDNVSAEVTLFLDEFSVGLNFSHFKNGGASVGLTLGTFLARDVRSSAWTVQHRRMANRSVASVRTFVDMNANKIFDTGDQPLSGVGFRNLSAWRKVRTNDDGVALLAGLLVHRPQTIELNLATVADPYLVPLSSGVNVVGHPGSIVDVEFPFSYVGEMEGMITEAGQPDHPIRHVGLELVDADGNRVKSTVGEYDGYYYFADIFPGEYKLAVIPSTINTNRYLVPDPVTITIPGEGGYIDGPEISLVRRDDFESPIPMPVDLAAAALDTVLSDEPEIAQTAPASGRTEAPDETPYNNIVTATPDTMPAAETQVVAAQQDTMTMTPAEAPAVASVETNTLGAASEPVAPTTDLATVPEFDRDQTMSLIFEMLHRNSLWPGEPIQ